MSSRERLAELLEGRSAADRGRILAGMVATRTWRMASETVAAVLMGPAGRRALRLGRFRSSGEVHLWMYDRRSLARSLMGAGLIGPEVKAPGDSAIPGFADYELEVRDGRVRKPDSLYIEAVKPPTGY